VKYHRIIRNEPSPLGDLATSTLELEKCVLCNSVKYYVNLGLWFGKVDLWYRYNELRKIRKQIVFHLWMNMHEISFVNFQLMNFQGLNFTTFQGWNKDHTWSTVWSFIPLKTYSSKFHLWYFIHDLQYGKMEWTRTSNLFPGKNFG
jgi:hypothetical protein